MVQPSYNPNDFVLLHTDNLAKAVLQTSYDLIRDLENTINRNKKEFNGKNLDFKTIIIQQIEILGILCFD